MKEMDSNKISLPNHRNDFHLLREHKGHQENGRERKVLWNMYRVGNNIVFPGTRRIKALHLEEQIMLHKKNGNLDLEIDLKSEKHTKVRENRIHLPFLKGRLLQGKRRKKRELPKRIPRPLNVLKTMEKEDEERKRIKKEDQRQEERGRKRKKAVRPCHPRRTKEKKQEEKRQRKPSSQTKMWFLSKRYAKKDKKKQSWQGKKEEEERLRKIDKMEHPR